MTDDHIRPWLTDDPLVLNTVLVVAATSFTVALTSCIWFHLRADPHKHLPDDPPSIISSALASLHLSLPRVVPQATQQPSISLPAPTDEQKDRKSTRSKERRRRGKDPFRDLFKGGKKSKALLRAIQATGHDHSPPSTDTLSNSSVARNDTASSTSRSQSPEPAADSLDMDRLAPSLGVESDDGSVRSTTPSGIASSPSVVASPTDISDQASSDAPPQTDGVRAHPDSMTVSDAEATITSASTVVASEDASSPSTTTACADVRAFASRDSQAVYTSGSCAKLVRARTKLRLSRMDPSVKSSLLSPTPTPLPDSVASSSNFIRSTPCPSLFITPSTRSSDGGPSTPTVSPGSTSPPRSLPTSEDPAQIESISQPSDESAASPHMQLASMRTALEAAHSREEQLRIEAEQASKERDELRWGWNEDAGAWRRREAELQAQIHHLMQQLQAYAAVTAFQAQQASSAFSSPTSPHAHASPRLQHHPLAPFPLPPPIQAQNSANPPAHVHALLASAPMLTPHPPGFAAPSGGVYPGPGFGMSPLLWSGMALNVPNRDMRHGGRRTPDSSASGSSPRGRRRRRGENVKSASDESSLGEWDGAEDGSEEDVWEEEEEDIFRNNVLADAILKRPESLRGLAGIGKRAGTRPPVHGTTGGGERIDALKDPALEKPGLVQSLVDTLAVGQ